MQRQRNYCLATWDATLPDHKEVRVPNCFAFFGIRSNYEAAKKLGDKLGIKPEPWMMKGHWVVAWDYVVGQGLDPFKELHMKLWEMSMLGIDFAWCTELIPELPRQPTDRIRNNCFPSLEEALEAFEKLSLSSNPDPSS